VLRERWEALTETQRRKFVPLCPDFVIESRSDSDRLRNYKRRWKSISRTARDSAG
jgi:Uma2 family endonuclease